MKRFYELPPIETTIFGRNIEFLPSVTEIFELDLAMREHAVLDPAIYLTRTAFAKSVAGQESLHFLLYGNSTDALVADRSASVQAYFTEGQFSTGYATHGLFPYRGKFHPQLVKALINIFGLQPGQKILDPMAGSGTTNIEAALLGVDSFAIDLSPFCQFMVKVKRSALAIDLGVMNELDLDPDKIFDFFSKGDIFTRLQAVSDQEKRKIYDLSFLAFLDALGYSKRVKRSDHRKLFSKVLARYLGTVSNFLSNPYVRELYLGDVHILADSDALSVKLDRDSVDCIITSPPYSFAIDYAENDRDQLEFLGYSPDDLKQQLIGLKGNMKSAKLENYFADLETFAMEMSRILKPGGYLTVVIGSNINQTGGIRLEQSVIDSAENQALSFVHSIQKPIRGLRSTMKDEYTLIFQKL